MKHCVFCMNNLDDSQARCTRCGKSLNDDVEKFNVLKHGTILKNRYYIGTVIGEGGFGIEGK